MQIKNPFPGLLGMNNQQPDPYQSLLGGYYTPQQAKMAWLGGSLQGLGAGLASGKSGAWAQGLALGGGEGLDNYRQRAVAASALDMRKQDQEWQMQERQRQSNEQQAQAEARDAWLANPDDEGLFAQAYPTQYATQKAKSLFPDQQGGSSSWGMSVVPIKNKRTGELAAGQFNQGSGGIFINGAPADPNEWVYDPGSLSQDRAEGTMAGSAPKVVIEQYTQKIRPEMSSIADTITTLNQAKIYLKKGIQTGSMADNIQALRSLGAQLGFNVDERVLADTQSYQNFIGNVVIPRMQALGGNDSNEELKKLYSLSGGDINQSLPALANTIDFIEQLQRRKFKTLKASEDVALRYIPGLTPIDLGGLAPPPGASGAVLDMSTMTDEQLEAIANGNQ